jgi:SAM-dependent methyltransferase
MTIRYTHSNPIDIFAMKRGVVADYERHVLASRTRARALLTGAEPGARCPVCGCEKFEIVAVIHGFRYGQCSGCTHVFHPHRIPDAALRQFYTDATGERPYSATYSEDPGAQEVRARSAAAPKVLHIASFLGEAAAGTRTWLDIACGNGDVPGIARSKGFLAQGIELSPTLAEIARRTHQIPVFEGTLLEYADRNPTARHDVVTFIGILDLLPEPAPYLEAASRIAREGGLLAVSVPHWTSLSAAVQKAYPDATIRFAYPNAFHLFTERSLTEAVRRHGFEPLGVWFYGMDMYELINNLALDSVRFRHSEARTILVELVNELQAVIDARHLSDEILMVARRTA